MKKQIAMFALVAAALIAAPAVVSAQDEKPAKKPQAGEAGAHSKNPRGLPLHGKVAAVDTAAGAITIGQMTINVTSETKIMKEGKPATISDITVGENITGQYKKDDSGKLSASVIHIGGKADKGESKKKKAEKTEKN
jgi:hypothetical protein